MILLPANFIRRYVDQNRFSVLSIPFEIPEIEISMFWHARMHHDPLHKWFRDFVYQNIYNRTRLAQIPE
jgi:DNA-binding transcriptional LysR family regulator